MAKYKNIATVLNAVYKANAEGDSASVVLAEDLSNIVDFGKSITDGTTFADLFATTFDTVIDKVRDTEFLTGKFVSNAPDCYMDDMGMAGMKEIVRVDVGDFSDSKMFDCVTKSGDSYFTNGNTFQDLFGKELPTVKAKYFNSHITYRQKYTFTANQFETAFTSPSAMAQFFSQIREKINQKYAWALDALRYLTFDSAVIEACADRASKIIVPAEEIGGEITAQSLAKQIRGIVRDLSVYSDKYSGDKFVTSTTDDDIRMVIYGEVYDDIVTQLATYHNPEYLNISVSNIKALPYMQYKEDAQTISGITPKVTSGKYGKLENIVAVIYNKKLCGCIDNNHKITSQYVANEDVTNYFDMADLEYIVNSDLPIVIITESGVSDWSEVNKPAESKPQA